MPQIQIVQDANELAARAAEFIIGAATASIAARGRFMWALAGGSTPEKTYKLLAQPENAARVDWAKVYVFFGDERFVAPTDGRSNYGMAQRTLLGRVPIPASHIFAVPTHLASVEKAAEAYNDTLPGAFAPDKRGEAPRFDLILLGLGDDGHTASLFPGAPSLQVRDRWVVDSPPGTLPPPVDRITFTFPVLNAAYRVALLVAGDNKAEAVRDVLEGNAAVESRPAAGVRPEQGELTWLLDTAAAKLLSKEN